MRRQIVSAPLQRLVRRRARDRCEYCRLPQLYQEATFHVDHVKPYSKGGKTHPANLALACVSCSLSKGARTYARHPDSGKPFSLFDPRNDAWSRHFRWAGDWRLMGVTGKGKATLHALGMNRPVVLAIRRELAALGHFP